MSKKAKITLVAVAIFTLSVGGYSAYSIYAKKNYASVLGGEELEQLIRERSHLSELPVEELAIHKAKLRISEQKVLKIRPPMILAEALQKIHSFDYEDDGRISGAVVCGEAIFFASTTGNVYEIKLKGLTENRPESKLKLKLSQHIPVAKRGFTCADLRGHLHLIIGGRDSVLIVDSDTFKYTKVKTSGLVAVPPVNYNNNIIFASMWPSRITSFDYGKGKVNWTLEASKDYGSNIWSAFVLTKDNNYIIAATGSPSNWEERKPISDTKYGTSNRILVVDPATGKVIYDEQIVEYDTWDWDNVGAPLVLESNSKVLDFVFLNKGLGIYRRRLEITAKGVTVRNSKKTVTLSAHLERKIVVDQENNLAYVFGDIPPQIKRSRVIDNYSGGPGWMGAVVSDDKNSIFVLENKNLLIGQYFDLIPDSRTYKRAVATLRDLKSCFKCHSSSGETVKAESGYIPSLSLVSRLLSAEDFESFMERSHSSPHYRVSTVPIKSLYESLQVLDGKLIEAGYKPYYDFDFSLYINNNLFESRTASLRNISTLFGTVSRIQLENLTREWIAPAGSYDSRLKVTASDAYAKENLGVGSLSWGGLTVHGDMLVLTGTLDRKLWVLDATTGSYLGFQPIPGVGTAPATKFSFNRRTYIAVPTKEERMVSMTIFGFKPID